MPCGAGQDGRGRRGRRPSAPCRRRGARTPGVIEPARDGSWPDAYRPRHRPTDVLAVAHRRGCGACGDDLADERPARPARGGRLQASRDVRSPSGLRPRRRRPTPTTSRSTARSIIVARPARAGRRARERAELISDRARAMPLDQAAPRQTSGAGPEAAAAWRRPGRRRRRRSAVPRPKPRGSRVGEQPATAEPTRISEPVRRARRDRGRRARGHAGLRGAEDQTDDGHRQQQPASCSRRQRPRADAALRRRELPGRRRGAGRPALHDDRRPAARASGRRVERRASAAIALTSTGPATNAGLVDRALAGHRGRRERAPVRRCARSPPSRPRPSTPPAGQRRRRRRRARASPADEPVGQRRQAPMPAPGDGRAERTALAEPVLGQRTRVAPRPPPTLSAATAETAGADGAGRASATYSRMPSGSIAVEPSRRCRGEPEFAGRWPEPACGSVRRVGRDRCCRGRSVSVLRVCVDRRAPPAPLTRTTPVQVQG